MGRCVVKHILVIQEYGIGNAILCTPLVRALAKENRVDLVLAKDRVPGLILKGVFEGLSNGRVLYDIVPPSVKYEVVMYCHPPGKIRPRPGQVRKALEIPTDPVKRKEKYAFRFSEHEVTACRKMAAGYATQPYDSHTYCCPAPPCRFSRVDRKQISIGIGYLKNHPFWAGKHFGNDNYVHLVDRLMEHPLVENVILVGDAKDRQTDGEVIAARCPARNMCGTGLGTILSVIMGSDVYIGNDTGLMHVAAAYDLPTIGIFQRGISNPVKNHPWCEDTVSLVSPTVDDVMRAALPFLERL